MPNHIDALTDYQLSWPKPHKIHDPRIRANGYSFWSEFKSHRENARPHRGILPCLFMEWGFHDPR